MQGNKISDFVFIYVSDDQALKDAIHSEAEITRLTEKLNDETVKRLRADRLYNEAQKQLKKKEDLILQQKKELFDFKVKNDEEKDFYDFFCNGLYTVLNLRLFTFFKLKMHFV